tara:strand:- start:218 stop:361 length:144 start_codon:yes stop_codon:yes gene_type:complete
MGKKIKDTKENEAIEILNLIKRHYEHKAKEKCLICSLKNNNNSYKGL